MRKFFLNDTNVLILIFINAIVIFLGGFRLSSSTQTIITGFDTFFTIAFIIEAYIKIKECSFKTYLSRGWNMFDFVLVMISLPSLLVLFLDLNIFDASFLLVFRTMRVFKIFRFFNFIPEIGGLLKSIRTGFKASVLIIITFTGFIFTVSILSNNMFGYSEIFKDPGTSIYSSLKLFTLEGWYEVPDYLTEGEESVWKVFFIRAYFVSVVVIGGIFGLSFVNAVLVDSMVMDNNEELTDKIDKLNTEISEMKELLKEIKDNNSPPSQLKP